MKTFNVGDRVRVRLTYHLGASAGRKRKTQSKYEVGTVIISSAGFVQVLLDSGENVVRSERLVRRVGPLEELALLGKSKSNPSSFNAAWIEPGGNIHKLDGRQTHRKWANTYLGMSGESTEAAIELTKRGWVWLTTPTELNVWQLDTPPAAAWRAAVTYSIEHAPATVHDETPVYIQPLAGGGLRSLTYKQFVRQYEWKVAAPIAKRNPEFKVGDRVRYRGAVGTVTEGNYGYPSTWCSVNFGGPRCRQRSQVRSEQLERLSDIEILAEAAKNPSSDLNVGDRVRFVKKGYKAPDVRGEIIEKTGYTMYRVRDDLPPHSTSWWDRSVLEPLSSVELLAESAKKNPDNEPAVGQKVRYRLKSQSVVNLWLQLSGRPPPTPDEIGTIIWFEPGTRLCGVSWPRRSLEEIPFSDLTVLSPLEELALVGKSKKNPSTSELRVGDRVKHTRHDTFLTYYGTVVAVDVRWGNVTLRWDEPGKMSPNRTYRPEELERVGPVEELALVAKGKKNPKERYLKPGERVYLRSKDWVGTVVEYPKDLAHSPWRRVMLDNGEEWNCIVTDLERITPMEELSRAYPK